MTAKRLDSIKGALATIMGQYRVTVAEFEGKTSALLEEDNAFALASWLKRHLAKLPGLINGCPDFGALAGVMDYAKILERGGCSHTESIPEGRLPSLEHLRKTLRNFIVYF